MFSKAPRFQGVDPRSGIYHGSRPRRSKPKRGIPKLRKLHTKKTVFYNKETTVPVQKQSKRKPKENEARLPLRNRTASSKPQTAVSKPVKELSQITMLDTSKNVAADSQYPNQQKENKRTFHGRNTQQVIQTASFKQVKTTVLTLKTKVPKAVVPTKASIVNEYRDTKDAEERETIMKSIQEQLSGKDEEIQRLKAEICTLQQKNESNLKLNLEYEMKINDYIQVNNGLERSLQTRDSELQNLKHDYRKRTEEVLDQKSLVLGGMLLFESYVEEAMKSNKQHHTIPMEERCLQAMEQIRKSVDGMTDALLDIVTDDVNTSGHEQAQEQEQVQAQELERTEFNAQTITAATDPEEQAKIFDAAAAYCFEDDVDFDLDNHHEDVQKYLDDSLVDDNMIPLLLGFDIPDLEEDYSASSTPRVPDESRYNNIQSDNNVVGKTTFDTDEEWGELMALIESSEFDQVTDENLEHSFSKYPELKGTTSEADEEWDELLELLMAPEFVQETDENLEHSFSEL